MNYLEATLLALLIAAGIALVLWICAGAVETAAQMLGIALAGGNLGVAAYTVLWVFALPVMLVVCLVGGAYLTITRAADAARRVVG